MHNANANSHSKGGQKVAAATAAGGVCCHRCCSLKLLLSLLLQLLLLTDSSTAPGSGTQWLLGCFDRYSATLGRSGVPPSRKAVWNVNSICCSAR